MEMCYDGALVMPSSYAVMNEEEMTYVEGGATYNSYMSAGAGCTYLATNAAAFAALALGYGATAAAGIATVIIGILGAAGAGLCGMMANSYNNALNFPTSKAGVNA